MKKNLINAGVFYPAHWPVDIIREQVADFLQIRPQQIVRLECWPHQIWVNIAAVGARFVSYRSLPVWTEQCIFLLQSCSQFSEGCTLEAVQAGQAKLEQLKLVFGVEVQQHGQHYPAGAIAQLRQA